MFLTVLKQDPDSIIALQADRRIRWGVGWTRMTKQNILNAAYDCGEPLAIEDLSGRNTHYLILIEIGGHDDPELAVPYRPATREIEEREKEWRPSL